MFLAGVKHLLNFTEKLRFLNDFPVTGHYMLPSPRSCFWKEHISAHSQPHPALPSRLSPRRGFAARPRCSAELSPEELTQVRGAHTWERRAGNPTKKWSHKYLLVIANVALQGLVVFSLCFFQFYLLDSLRFHSQNIFYPNKGFYYYYSPVITRH